MRWLAATLRRLLAGAPALDTAHAASLNAYRALPSVDLAAALSAMRFVVVDVETSGLDPASDRLIAIGAIAVEGRLVRFAERFESVLRQHRASATENILVHGIDGTTQVGAPEPAETLLAFLDFSRKSPLVAFHADFDRTFIEREMRKVLGVVPENPWLDLAHLVPALFPEHAATLHSLDDWTFHFGIANHARHDALADAVATAQLLQVAIARAEKSGEVRARDLVAQADAHRWLAAHPPTF